MANAAVALERCKAINRRRLLRKTMGEIREEANILAIDLRMMTHKTNQLFVRKEDRGSASDTQAHAA